MTSDRMVGSAAADRSRATPLELFFDLVYVFAFTQVTHLMADGQSIQSVLGGVAVLGVLWWSWASHAWLANQQVADRGPVRVGILTAIAIVLVLSIALPEAYPAAGESLFGALLFATGFVVLSLVYTAVNLVVARGDRTLRRQVLRTMGVTIVPVSIALISGALLGGTAQIALWLAAVAIEGVTIYFTSQGGAWLLPSAAHYAERHGLVVILALGESIISIGLAASHSPLTPGIVIASLLAVVVALGMWWAYFGRVSGTAERSIEGMTGNRRTTTATIGTYLHFGIVAGILLASLGLGGALEHLGDGRPPAVFDGVALATGLALFLGATVTYSTITRASSGIGEAAARHLAAIGYPVVLGARRTERLATIVDEIRAAGGRADYAELNVADLASMRAFVETALTLHGIAAVLPSMEAQGRGHIINVASVSGLRVNPTAAVYSATKFGVRALSEGLRQESTVVRVTVISPGFTVSELANTGGDASSQSAARAATEQLGLPASAVAEAIGYAIAQPDSVDVNEIVVRPTLQR